MIYLRCCMKWATFTTSYHIKINPMCIAMGLIPDSTKLLVMFLHCLFQRQNICKKSVSCTTIKTMKKQKSTYCTKRHWKRLSSCRSPIRWTNIVGHCSVATLNQTNTIVHFGECAKKHLASDPPFSVLKKILIHQLNITSVVTLNIYGSSPT